MLEGIVAAGFHCCFFGTGRGWLRAGTGTAALALGGFFLPGIRPAVPLLTALWIMLTGFWLHEGRREEGFLAGGLWLMALALAEKDCEILSLRERDESLESYFINLIGGGGDE